MDSSTIARVAAAVSRLGGSVRVRSVANPALWAFTVSFGFYCAVLIAGREPPIALTVIVCSCTALMVLTLVWFSLREPDRLQDEEIQFRKHTINLLAEKGTKAQLSEAVKIALAANNAREFSPTKDQS